MPRNAYTVIGEERVRVLSPPGEFPAQQQFKEDCDINTIMKRFQKTGVIDHVAKYQSEYGLHTPLDYHRAMNLVSHAQSMFNELPSSIRDEFSNNPEAFLEFVQDPNNADRAKELGIELSPEAAAQAAANKEQEVPQPGEATPQGGVPAQEAGTPSPEGGMDPSA